MKYKRSGTVWGEVQASVPSQAKRINFPTEKACYEIEVEEQVDAEWSEWLDGMALEHNDAGNTLIKGYIPDQAALYGVLVKIRDLGLSIISLKRVVYSESRKDCEGNNS